MSNNIVSNDVFAKHRVKAEELKKSNNKSEVAELLKHMQQELIEKIKQELGECDTQFHTTHYNILRKLIGDNQE